MQSPAVTRGFLLAGQKPRSCIFRLPSFPGTLFRARPFFLGAYFDWND